MTCRHCGEPFTTRPGKPGFIDECPTCTKPDSPRLGGNMVWAHKTAPELEIKPLATAQNFAKKQRRFGAGVTACLTQSQTLAHKTLNGYSKLDGEHDRDAEVNGSVYRTRLGESRKVK